MCYVAGVGAKKRSRVRARAKGRSERGGHPHRQRAEAWCRAVVEDAARVSSTLEAEMLVCDHLASTRDPDQAAADLLLYVASQSGPTTRKVLAALASVGPTRVAEAARQMLGTLGEVPGREALSGRPPGLVRGWLGEDSWRDRQIVLAEFEYPGEEAHGVAWVVDPALGGLIRHVVVASPADSIRQRLGTWPELRARFVEATPELVAASLRRGLRAVDSYRHTGLVDQDVLQLQRLLEYRAAVLPPTPLLAIREEVGDDAREALLRDFLRSKQARGLDEPDITIALAIDFKADHSDGDPLRWSPEVIRAFLLGWYPRYVMGLDDVERVPGRLEAWVRYAGSRRGMSEAMIEEMVREVRGRSSEFLEAATDPSRFGVAKTISLALLAGGVDPEDKVAALRWLEEHRTVLLSDMLVRLQATA